MQEPVEERNGRRLDWQEVAPLFKRPMTRQAQAATLVRSGDEPKQQLGTGVVEWSEAQLVDQDQLVAQQMADHLANGVVGQAAVEGLDQVGRDQVADLLAT